MNLQLPSSLTEKWHLDGAILLADTPTSTVFRAKQDGGSVIVKCIKQRGIDELNGIAYLQWRDGASAVRVIDVFENNCLMEDAGEKTLRRLHEEHGEAEANKVLAEFLPGLFEVKNLAFPQNLPDLRRHLGALFHLASHTEPGDLEAPIRLAARYADELLQNQQDARPLHGDIHHENIISDGSGRWRVIDPKGISGDPHYDVANLFGNPDNNPENVLDPLRAEALTDMLVSSLHLNRERMLQFAIAHCGASIAWSYGDSSQKATQNIRQRAALIPILQNLLER